MSIIITITENEFLKESNNYSLGELVRKKYYEIKKNQEDSFDHCVICGRETPYLRSTHIDHRIGYVEGGGQGCYQPNTCDKV